MKSKKGRDGGRERESHARQTVQLIAILHHLVDIKYLFRGGNEHNAMGKVAEIQGDFFQV